MNLADVLTGAVVRALSVDEESLTLGLDATQQYHLVVYNEYTIESAKDSPTIIGSKVEQVGVVDDTIWLVFSNRSQLIVSLAAAHYSGPEALVLYDAVGAPLIVAN